MSYTCIPEWQRNLHVVSETLALISIPFTFAAAAAARGPHKRFLWALAIGTLLVDGLLLLQWPRLARQAAALPPPRFQ